MPGILQDVHERRSNLARSPQRPRVETIGENGTATLPQRVEGPRDPDEEPLHPARERPPVAGFGDQVEMVRLEENCVRRNPKRSRPAWKAPAIAFRASFRRRLGSPARSRTVRWSGWLAQCLGRVP